MLRGNFRGFWPEGVRGGLLAALHGSWAGLGAVWGLRGRPAPRLNSESAKCRRASECSGPQGPEGRARHSAGCSEGLEGVGGSPWLGDGANLLCFCRAGGGFFSPSKLSSLFCLPKIPTKRTRAAGQATRRPARTASKNPQSPTWLSCPMVVRGRRAPRRRKFPSRHASVPLREQCRARTTIRLGELGRQSSAKVAALLAVSPKPREDP